MAKKTPLEMARLELRNTEGSIVYFRSLGNDKMVALFEEKLPAMREKVTHLEALDEIVRKHDAGLIQRVVDADGTIRFVSPSHSPR